MIALLILIFMIMIMIKQQEQQKTIQDKEITATFKYL